jgi:hypothetical protein
MWGRGSGREPSMRIVRSPVFGSVSVEKGALDELKQWATEAEGRLAGKGRPKNNARRLIRIERKKKGTYERRANGKCRLKMMTSRVAHG